MMPCGMSCYYVCSPCVPAQREALLLLAVSAGGRRAPRGEQRAARGPCQGAGLPDALVRSAAGCNQGACLRGCRCSGSDGMQGRLRCSFGGQL